MLPALAAPAVLDCANQTCYTALMAARPVPKAALRIFASETSL